MHFYFLFTYNLTNCVVMHMLLAKYSQTRWNVRGSRVEAGPTSSRVLAHLDLVFALAAKLGHRRSVASNSISRLAVAGGIVPRKPNCFPEPAGWRAGTRGSPPRY